ncbi:lytic transglycosylase domain-containing protein [Luteimonas suaedae]|uniref:lytic transglycosylase domain-containing protein n=1 Tax=Luteimonas suaedae TaxID=2605430 RepID=UPI0011EFFFDF|nr:lytic transglycosylase domain-containing protein [Luteimonas suaedae]
MKGARGNIILTALCALAAFPAAAGTLYRCDSGDGVPQYVSKRIGGASCTVISSYRPEPNRARSTAAPAAAGKVTADNRVEGSPATLHNNPPATFMGQGAAAPVATATAPAKPAAAQPRTRHVQGQVYSYIKDGVRHYTSRAPRGVAGASAVRTIRYSFMETCYACGATPGVSFGTVRLNTDAYRDEIAAAARRFGVEEAVVRAIIHAESAFNPNALSRVGAQGLMQLMPATARRFGVGNPFDPGQNILGGVQYLAWLLKRFNGDLTLAAAGYNAGEGAVDRHGGVPPYSETRRYVERVGVLAERYRGHLAANTAP